MISFVALFAVSMLRILSAAAIGGPVASETFAAPLGWLAAAVLLWVRPTRMIGVALSGAAFLVWVTQISMGGVSLALILASAGGRAGILMVAMFLLEAFVSMCGGLAAIRAFFTYGGTLSEVPA